MTDSAELARYLPVMKAHHTLSGGSETALMTRAQRGDLAARNELVQYHLALVIQRVFRIRAPPHAFHDLVQEGCLGLLRAIEKFEPARGLRFSTYATYWIDGLVLRYAKSISFTVVHRRGCGVPDVDLGVIMERPDPAPNPEEKAIRAAEVQRVRNLLDRFRVRLRAIGRDLVHCRLSADGGATLDEVANRHGVSREWARQIEKRTKAFLRRVLNDAA